MTESCSVIELLKVPGNELGTPIRDDPRLVAGELLQCPLYHSSTSGSSIAARSS